MAVQYYDGNDLLSKNRVINMVIGERSIGKSYFFKKYPIQKFKNSGRKFIYLRRYKSELKKVNQYFADIGAEFPNDQLTVKGWDFYINKEHCGTALPLSAWQSLKSNAYPEYDTIVFDEFIREKDRSGYLPNEVSALLGMAYTIFRRRKGVRIILLGNSASIVNPYFLEFGIQFNKEKQFIIPNNEFKKLVVVENTGGLYTPKEEDLSDFERVIRLSEYGKLALDNDFIDDNNTFIVKKSKHSKFAFAVGYNGKTYGVWVDLKLGLMFLSNQSDPSTNKYYPLSVEDHNEDSTFLKNYREHYMILKMVNAFKKGLLRFEDQFIKNTAYEFFKKMNIF